MVVSLEEDMLEYRIAITVFLILLALVALRFKINGVFIVILSIILGGVYLLLSYYQSTILNYYLTTTIIVIFGFILIKYGFRNAKNQSNQK